MCGARGAPDTVGWGSVIVGLLTLLVVVLFFGGLAAIFAFAANQ